MPRVSAAFFLTGGLFVLTGMIWGIYMGAAENFQLAPAHAHLNLLGWVTMALYGSFYAFTAKTMSVKLAWTNYIVSALGVLVMIPSLAAFLTTSNQALIPVMAVGELLTVSGLVIFLISATREAMRRRTTATEADATKMRIAA
jgi:hypothetical protein